MQKGGDAANGLLYIDSTELIGTSLDWKVASSIAL